MTPLQELSRQLRPAGGGLYLVSTGREAQLALQRHLYRAQSEQEVQDKFLRSLEAIRNAKVVILGVPSDVGAGFQRGANLGPQGIRSTLLAEDPHWPERCAERGIVDIGDVFVVPQLLHDDMLSESQRCASHASLYPDLPIDIGLPVSPLSIEERALELVFAINPSIKPFVIGGDHSTAWPVAANLAKQRGSNWAIVQPDAHTDLLAERLGVKYCFATWSYHANELLGRGKRLIQVGTRASRYDKAHWEGTLDVLQFWGDECNARPDGVIDDILSQLVALGRPQVYFSNDIDGTDAAFADATGTPETGGVTPDFLLRLIKRLGQEVGLCAADIMEVAPSLSRSEGGVARTLALAAQYTRASLDAMVASG